MPEGPPPRKLSGWEVELGPGHWEALSGRVLSSDVNVSYSDLVDVASRRLELYQLQVAPYGELGRRFAVAKPKEVQRVRSRRCYWMVGSSTQGWITCPNDLQERLERRDTAAVEDSALGRCASVKGWWEEGSSGKLSFKQHFVEGILDGWADEGGGPYRLTLGLLGKIDAEDFTGFRSQRPREMKAAKGKVEKKLPESKKPPWIPSHCSIAVKGWSSVDGFCLKSDTFELWGDWQTDGGLLGTIGRDGSQGTFHLKVFAAPMEQAVEPRWLASQWARLHPTWHSMTVLRLRGSPLLEDGNIIHEVNWTADDQSFPEELRLRVCFGPDLDVDDAFWRLAPGEVQRLGGAEDSPPGFVVATYHSRQTLELDPPKTLAPAIQVEDNEDPNEGPKEDGDGDMQREPKRAREPLLLPLRFAPSKAFPHALVGPWLRGGALIEVGHHFSCREADDTFQMQIFPEIVYPHWGGWILDVARSSSLVLEWVTKVNVENRGKTRTIRWIRPWVFKGMIEVLSAGTSEVDGVYLPDFTGNIMKYTKEGGDIELRHVKGIWELAPAETEDKVYYAYETLNPAEGQWDANSAVMGNVPAPCVRLWLAEEKLVQEALRQSHETSPHMVPLDSLRWNVLPRYVNVLKISERETSLCLSEGLLQHFSGDATVIFDFSDFSSSLASFWAPEALESESLAGFTLTTYDAGQMPSIWCTVARPEGGVLPNQLGSTESFTFQGQEVLRRAVLRLREKGALIFALQLLLPDMTGSIHADVAKKSDTFVAALTHVLLESDYGASGPPKEVHLVVDAPEEIITCRKCVERVIAKRSDASFLNAMKVESNHRPKWLTETLLQDLQPRRPRSKLPSVNAKKLKEDPAVRGILVWQFSKLAEVVRDVLNQEEIADEGPYAVSPGSALKWLEVNMYHICQHFILPLTMDNACSYVELVANDLQVPEWMVSHAWSTNFAATSGMLMQHALSRRSSAVDEKETEQSMCYWCCTLANNQHDLSALQDPDLLKTPFARVLLSPTCCGTVLLCDPAVTPLKRVWCVFEAHLTQKLRSTDLSSKGCHFLDLVAFDQKKSLTFEAHALAILQDGAKGWNEIAQGGAHFPLEVAHAGTTVDVRFAEASLQSDRRAIMNHIAYGKASAQAPPVKHPSYDQLNDFVHSAFASAELYRLACDRPEGCVERAKELLLLGADPNSFIREGNTALLALVGADPTQPAPAELEVFQEMSSLLIENGARINHVNSHMQTALDHLQEKMENSELVEYMKKQGARSFEESAIEAEEHWNECIKEVLWKGGFGAPSEKVGKTTQAFGGSGGGGTGAKLLGKAEQSLREAASYLKVYPKAPCFIDTPSGAHDKHNLRGKSVLAALKASGAPNPLELRCSGTWHPRGSLPLLQLKISLATKT